MIKTQHPKYLANSAAEVTIDTTPRIQEFPEESESGGSYVQIRLNSGRIVLVWDVSVEDETKACIQVYDNVDLVDEGSSPNIEVLV